MDEKTVLTIAKDAASAVLHLHSGLQPLIKYFFVKVSFFYFNNVENLVHRDIAARNVLLSENYVAKLTGKERKRLKLVEKLFNFLIFLKKRFWIESTIGR